MTATNLTHLTLPHLNSVLGLCPTTPDGYLKNWFCLPFICRLRFCQQNSFFLPRIIEDSFTCSTGLIML